MARDRLIERLTGLFHRGAVFEVAPNDLGRQSVERSMRLVGFPRVENGNLDLRVDGETRPLEDHFGSFAGGRGRSPLDDPAAVDDGSKLVRDDGVREARLDGSGVGSVRERERLRVLGGLEHDLSGVDQLIQQGDQAERRLDDDGGGCVLWLGSGVVLVGLRRVADRCDGMEASREKNVVDIATLLSSCCVLVAEVGRNCSASALNGDRGKDKPGCSSASTEKTRLGAFYFHKDGMAAPLIGK